MLYCIFFYKNGPLHLFLKALTKVRVEAYCNNQSILESLNFLFTALNSLHCFLLCLQPSKDLRSLRLSASCLVLFAQWQCDTWTQSFCTQSPVAWSYILAQPSSMPQLRPLTECKQTPGSLPSHENTTINSHTRTLRYSCFFWLTRSGNNWKTQRFSRFRLQQWRGLFSEQHFS